jgi:hypothetical protein
MKTFYVAGPAESAKGDVSNKQGEDGLFFLVDAMIPAFETLDELRRFIRPEVKPGETTIYRVTVEATNEEAVRVN